MMNAQEIRDALKPFQVFAPAINRAAEIVQAAEDAEKAVKDLEKQKAAMEKELAQIEKSRTDAVNKMQAAKQEFNAFVAEHEEKKQALRDELTAAGLEVKKAEDRVKALDAEFADKRKAKEAEVADEQKVLEKVKAEIERLKKAFAA